MSATEDRYAKWAQNYHASMGIRAAAMERMKETAQARARAQAPKAKANRAQSLAERRCVVSGCKFVWHKGRLCKKHWGQVPQEAKIAAMLDAMQTQKRVADKHHRKMERDLKAALSQGFES